jgi:uncharacterized protein YutE (UPF0331/DUF86 family)
MSPREEACMDDVEINKAAIIERCIARVREEYAGDRHTLTENITKQDSVILNLQRACEAAVDLAMHRVRVHRLGVPQDSRDAFDLLARAGKLEGGLVDSLKRMVGFRNIAIHDYQALNLAIVAAIIEHHLDDLRAFARLN